MQRINDEERRLWVLNDEGLYDRYIASRLSIREFIRRNRAMLDAVIKTVVTGQKPAHYLKYDPGLQGFGDVPGAVKVKCTQKKYFGVDQYGNTYHGLVHPRTDLLRRLGKQHADRMYVDTPDGGAKVVGYVIGGLWISIHEVCEWKPSR